MSFGEPGERLRTGYCNLYQQGWYHRAGKPTTMSAHPGDMYPTREAALADIDPEAAHLYLATAMVMWEHPGGPHEVYEYGPDSVPDPISVTRKVLARSAPEAEVLVGQSNPEAESLDTGDGEAVELTLLPKARPDEDVASRLARARQVAAEGHWRWP